jgi:hypothetical protein
MKESKRGFYYALAALSGINFVFAIFNSSASPWGNYRAIGFPCPFILKRAWMWEFSSVSLILDILFSWYAAYKFNQYYVAYRKGSKSQGSGSA